MICMTIFIILPALSFGNQNDGVCAGKQELKNILCVEQLAKNGDLFAGVSLRISPGISTLV